MRTPRRRRRVSFATVDSAQRIACARVLPNVALLVVGWGARPISRGRAAGSWRALALLPLAHGLHDHRLERLPGRAGGRRGARVPEPHGALAELTRVVQEAPGHLLSTFFVLSCAPSWRSSPATGRGLLLLLPSPPFPAFPRLLSSVSFRGWRRRGRLREVRLAFSTEALVPRGERGAPSPRRVYREVFGRCPLDHLLGREVFPAAEQLRRRISSSCSSRHLHLPSPSPVPSTTAAPAPRAPRRGCAPRFRPLITTTRSGAYPEIQVQLQDRRITMQALPLASVRVAKQNPSSWASVHTDPPG